MTVPRRCRAFIEVRSFVDDERRVQFGGRIHPRTALSLSWSLTGVEADLVGVPVDPAHR